MEHDVEDHLSQYQAFADGTALFPPVFMEDKVVRGAFHTSRLIYPALGLAGEAGEFCNKVKKIIRDTSGEISEERGKQLLDELGDVLWYVSTCVTELNGLLDEVAQNNINKLYSRLERRKIQGDGDER